MDSSVRRRVRPLLRAFLLISLGAAVSVAITLEVTGYRPPQQSSGAGQSQEIAGPYRLDPECRLKLNILALEIPEIARDLRRAQFVSRASIDITVEALNFAGRVVNDCLVTHDR